jgi:3-hydroxyisobutyrate dehydrogenase-like beta-hydroxyacid dehydrogenase
VNKHDVTVVGLGAMGHALAAAFLANGHRTTVWNRTPGKADDLVAGGATRANTVAEALAASPVVVVCMLDYPTLYDVLGDSGDGLDGRVLVNLTNGTPAQARAAADWADKRRAEYLDGGIMAVPPMIGQPGSLVLYSGSEPAFDRHREDLLCLGEARYVGAEAGRAALTDLALLSAMYGMFAGAGHALAMVGSEQIDRLEFTSSLLVPWLTAMSTILPTIADSGDSGSEDSPADMQAVGIANIAKASNDQQLDPGLLGHLVAPLRELIGPRGAGADLTTLIEMVR